MYEFTSESVSVGHPDKVADLISDAVANYLIDGNIRNRAAVETLVTTNMVTLAGEYKSDKFDKVYIERAGNIVNAKKTSAAIAKAYIVRKYLSKTGYDKIRMYDDAPKNLDMINKLKKLNKDVSLDLHLVTPSGNIKKYK